MKDHYFTVNVTYDQEELALINQWVKRQLYGGADERETLEKARLRIIRDAMRINGLPTYSKDLK